MDKAMEGIVLPSKTMEVGHYPTRATPHLVHSYDTNTLYKMENTVR